MIDRGEVKNQSELARIKGISRARVTQILNLLKLDKSIINNLEQIGDPMDRKKYLKEDCVKSYISADALVLILSSV